MVASVRPFIPVEKVMGDPTGEQYLTAFGVRFLRLWEPEGTDPSVTEEVGTGNIKDLCEIYSEAKVKRSEETFADWKRRHAPARHTALRLRRDRVC